MKKIIKSALVIGMVFFLFSCFDTTGSDNTAPAVTITFPVNNAEFTFGVVITIEVTAEDENGIKEVRFFIDGVEVALDDIPPYDYVWDTISAKNSSHAIYAKAWDSNDNVGTSNTINVSLTNTVTDYDGNIYQTMLIDDQLWMIENLKVTHYRNGDLIPHITENVDWINGNNDAYCIYNNTPSNAEIYGNLYNWLAVDDSRGLAPEGWHVANDDEWKELEKYLGMTQTQADAVGFRGTNQGSALAGSLDLWNDGVLVINTAFGTSGFLALPGGYRNDTDGNFYDKNNAALFWTSSYPSVDHAWYRNIYFNNTGVNRTYDFKNHGFNVRCIMD